MLDTPAPAPGFAALIDSFTLYLEGMGRSPRTVFGYRSGATMFAAWCAAHDGPAAPADVTRPHLSGFLRDLLAGGAASSANTRYWQLRAFFRWLLEEEEIRRSPLARVPAPMVPEDWPTVPHADEIRRLLGTCRGRTFVDLRDRALILFAVDSGARVGEMASMRITNLDLRAHTAIVLANGGHTRPLVYGTAVASALDRYLRARARHATSAAPHVWLGLQGRFTPSGMGQMLTARSQRAGLARHVHPHAFRHFFVSEFLRSGGNETDVVRLAGWRTRKMVDRYAQMTSFDRALRF